MPAPTEDHRPRLLALHGGGTNARVFTMQCRTLTPALSSSFRLVFADAPFISDPHPAIIPVYENMGPYKRWLRFYPSLHPPLSDESAEQRLEKALRKAMEADDKAGGRGEWVGLIGFSQGAKIATSVLFDMQLRAEQAAQGDEVVGFAGGKWKFAVAMAGRPPFVKLSAASDGLGEKDGVIGAGQIPELPTPEAAEKIEVAKRLKWPTLHVRGLKDEGHKYQKVLWEKYCEQESAELLEWDGNHRIVFKAKDVNMVADAILRVAKAAGVPIEENAT